MRPFVMAIAASLLLAVLLAGCTEPPTEESAGPALDEGNETTPAPADPSPAASPAATSPEQPLPTAPTSVQPDPSEPAPEATPTPPTPEPAPPAPPTTASAPEPPPAPPTPPPPASAPPPSPSPSPSTASGAHVRIANVQFDAPGNERANLREEWVEIANEGDAAADLTGWRLQDDAAHAYRFPAGFVLQPGAHVKVRTGEGADTATDLYWGSGNAVWNNDGDVAYLYDASHALVDRREG